MGVFNNISKKNKKIYGPVQNEKSDNIMLSAIEKAQSNPQIMQQKKQVDAGAAKYRTENPNTPAIGGGTYTVKAGDASRSVQTSPVKTSSPPQDSVISDNVQMNTPYYDPNMNYADLLNQGMANGAAAKDLMPYWNQRQQKIASDPSLSKYQYDDTYKNWMKYTGADSDIASRIYAAMASGASASEVERLLQERNYKISQNQNLSQYAYDDVYRAAMNYINSKQQPYSSSYDTRVKDLIKDINNQKFEYNFEDDPLYQQYLNQAREQGNMAMQDTLAQSAAAAGGMNSYAVAAAQGIQNNYMQRVNDVIPQLYQMAYNKYQGDYNRKLNMLDTYLGLDDRDYSRWASERDYNDSRSDLVYDREKAQEQWDYNTDLNERQWKYNTDLNERQWNYQLARDNKSDEDAERENAQSLVMAAIQSGFMPDDELIEKSGIPRSYLQSMLNVYSPNFNQGMKGGGALRGSNGRSSYKDNDDGDRYETEILQNNSSKSLGTDLITVNDKYGVSTYTRENLKKALQNGDVEAFEENGKTVYYKKGAKRGLL